ncbi:MAG: RNA methyltransferase [Oscillospiraceae bacterium]|nr:RNA methyltransferase [Oscillospiraceae bacterium]MBQ6403016.1 RNA methyltransferase [Oscillospiraceae bacterium]
MDRLTSRKNPVIRQLRALGRERSARAEAGLFIGDGEKLLREAIQSGAEIDTVLWAETPALLVPNAAHEFTAPAELVEYVSALSHSPGPVFTVRMQPKALPETLRRVIVLETVQDPGNVGTVLRTANALGMDAVILTGSCADLYSPKTVRSTMGAIFRMPVIECSAVDMKSLLMQHGLPLYGAALSDSAKDLRTVALDHAAVAIGSEGQGLSRELLSLCDGEIIIPMRPESESLNAAIAASVVMWEMARTRECGA